MTIIVTSTGLYVRTFNDFRPPATDGVLFTQARIEEAPDVAGAPGEWVELEVQAVAPYNTGAPPAMDFTTELATLQPAWYRIVWVTAAGATFSSDPVYFDPDSNTDQPWFPVSEFRARYPKLTDAKYPDDKVEENRLAAELAIEREIGMAYVPRRTTTTSRLGGTDIYLPHRAVRRILSAKSGGQVVDLATAHVTDTVAILGAGWPIPVEISYEHGLDGPPPEGKQAAMILTKAWLVDGLLDERITQEASEFGVVNRATPGMFGSRFGIPAVDAFVNAEKRRYGIGIGVL